MSLEQIYTAMQVRDFIVFEREVVAFDHVIVPAFERMASLPLVNRDARLMLGIVTTYQHWVTLCEVISLIDTMAE